MEAKQKQKTYSRGDRERPLSAMIIAMKRQL